MNYVNVSLYFQFKMLKVPMFSSLSCIVLPLAV